jgi:hypothetical protein
VRERERVSVKFLWELTVVCGVRLRDTVGMQGFSEMVGTMRL